MPRLASSLCLLLSVASLWGQTSRAPVPRRFDQDTVKGMIAHIDEPPNANVLKAAFFATRRTQPLSRQDCLEMLSEAAANSERHSKRWLLLNSVLAFGCFQTAAEYHKQGLDVYEELFDAHAEILDQGFSSAFTVAMADFLNIAAGDRRRNSFNRHWRQAEQVLARLAHLYLTLPELGNGGELVFSEAISRTGGAPKIARAVNSLLQDFEEPSYEMLKRAAALLEFPDPAKSRCSLCGG